MVYTLVAREIDNPILVESYAGIATLAVLHVTQLLASGVH